MTIGSNTYVDRIYKIFSAMIIKLAMLFMMGLLTISFEHYVFGAANLDEAMIEANDRLERLLNSTSVSTDNISNQTTEAKTTDNNMTAVSNQTTEAKTTDNNMTAGSNQTTEFKTIENVTTSVSSAD